MPDVMLEKSRRLALITITILIAASALASFAQSYRDLIDWALTHRDGIPWAFIAPLSVDTFVIVGELTLFAALVSGWSWRSRVGGWLITLTGLALSVAGNVWHLHSATWEDRITAGVWPVAASAALAVGLGVLKRTRADRAAAAVLAPVAAPVAVPAAPPRMRRLFRWLRQALRHLFRAIAPPVPDPLAPPVPEPLAPPVPEPLAPPVPRKPRISLRFEPESEVLVPVVPAKRRSAGSVPAEKIEAARAEVLRAAGNGGLPSARALAASHLGGNRRLAKELLDEAMEAEEARS